MRWLHNTIIYPCMIGNIVNRRACSLAGKVAPYKTLRGGVRFVAEIPKSASGKILHRVMREEMKKITI